MEPFLDWDVIQCEHVFGHVFAIAHVFAHELAHVFVNVFAIAHELALALVLAYVRHMHAFAIAQNLVPDGLYSSHGLAHGSFAHGLAQGLSHGLSHGRSHGIARPGAQVSEHRQLHQRLCAISMSEEIHGDKLHISPSLSRCFTPARRHKSESMSPSRASKESEPSST